jgi:hypothetical protein
VAASYGLYGREVTALDDHTLFEIGRKYRLLLWIIEAGAVCALDPERIAGRQRLAEANQPTAQTPGLVSRLGDLFQCGDAVESDRRNLRHADHQFVLRPDID